MTQQFLVDGCQHIIGSREDVAALTTAVRLAIYNQLTGRATKKFATTEKGVEQTWKEIEAKAAAPAKMNGTPVVDFEEDPPPPPKPAPAGAETSSGPAEEAAPEAAQKTKRKKKEKQPAEPKAPRTLLFNMPLADDTKRPGRGKRKTIFEMIQRPQGATFEELQAATGWVTAYFQKEGKTAAEAEQLARKTTYEGIRLLNTYCGYGLKTDAEGRIHAVVPKEGKAA